MNQSNESLNSIYQKTYRGNIDIVAGTLITGWAARIDGEIATIHIYVNDKLVLSILADRTRNDLLEYGLAKKGGGFKIDIEQFIPSTGASIKITTNDGVVINKGHFEISTKKNEILTYFVGDLSNISVGIFGNSKIAIDQNSGSVLSKILAVLGVKTLVRPEHSDCNIWFCHPTTSKPKNIALVNGGFKSAEKSAIDVAHRNVFGRGVCVSVNELKDTELYVIKSEYQAAHDGRIVKGKDITFDSFDGIVIQKLIDNTIDHKTVYDIRVPYIGGEIPFAYIKTRDISERFSNGNKSAYPESVRPAPGSTSNPLTCMAI